MQNCQQSEVRNGNYDEWQRFFRQWFSQIFINVVHMLKVILPFLIVAEPGGGGSFYNFGYIATRI